VYLNGKLDNGALIGTVTARQRSSREPLVIGHRNHPKGFEFEGFIDDVRLYSRPLNEPEILQVMRGRDPTNHKTSALHGGGRGATFAEAEPQSLPCGIYSDREDARLPGLAAVLGVLVAIFWLGFPVVDSPGLCLGVSYAAGLLLLTLSAPALPLITQIAVAGSSIAGCLAVLVPIHFQSASSFPALTRWPRL
jgi:hypothetical protein